MPMAEVALAAGFSSIRRFNATFQCLYQRPPRELRRSKLTVSSKRAERITLKLPYAPPRILLAHPPDQIAQLPIGFRAPYPILRFPAPNALNPEHAIAESSPA